MILSIDLNPVLKRKYFKLDEVKPNLKIAEDYRYDPGGEAIELAYLLSSLNENVMLGGLLGGMSGQYIKDCLNDDNVDHLFFTIKDETSEHLIFSTANEKNHIKTRVPRITMDEVNRFLDLYKELVIGASTVCLFGQLSNLSFKDIYYNMTLINNRFKKKTLMALDSVEELEYALEAKPNVVLIEKDQLEQLTNLSLDYQYEIKRAGKYILEKGLELVLIPAKDGSSIVLTKDKIYGIEYENPKVSIDIDIHRGHMLGGLAFAMERQYDLEMILKLGQACGISESIIGKNQADMSDIKKIMGKVKINSFNY